MFLFSLKAILILKAIDFCNYVSDCTTKSQLEKTETDLEHYFK